jgi:hypothetical protein
MREVSGLTGGGAMTPDERTAARGAGVAPGVGGGIVGPVAVGGGVRGLGGVGSILAGAADLLSSLATTAATTAAAAPKTAASAAGARRWLLVTGGTTVIAGGVFAKGVASRSTLPARMILLERFTGVKGPVGTGAGDMAAGGRIAGRIGAAATGVGTDGITGFTATGAGTAGVAEIGAGVTGVGTATGVGIDGLAITGVGIEGATAATGGGTAGTALGTTGGGVLGAEAATGVGIDGLATMGVGIEGTATATGGGTTGTGLGTTGGGVLGAEATTGTGIDGTVFAIMGGGVAGTAIGGGVDGWVAETGSGGWKRRADLRRIGSTGGMMVLDFLDGSRGIGIAGTACFTSVGGKGGGGAGIDAVLRRIGATGGTMGADFLAAGGIDGAVDKIAAVLLGIIGSAEVGAVMGEIVGGIATEVVRRGRATDGGFDVGASFPPGAMGGGMMGACGGLIVGEIIGDDWATGSGIFDGPEGITPAGCDGGAKGGGVGGVAATGMGNEGCLGKDGTSGGCGASGSGTRAVFVSAAGVIGCGGIVVREVSARPGEVRFGMPTVSFVIEGREPVMGSAGGRLSCETAPRSESDSVFPLTKTLACGFAMMTRGGAGTRPEAVGTRPDAVVGGIGVVAAWPAGGGMLGGVNGVVGAETALPGTSPVSGGALVDDAKTARNGEVFDPGSEPLSGGVAGRTLAGVGRTSGCVFARVPVSDPDCLICDGAGPTRPVGGRVGFCIGWVTAVDHVGGGGVVGEAVGVILSDDFIGIVAALPDDTRESWVESGFSGRGGSVTRKVSRFWGFDSAEGGASSAIMKFFIDNLEKCSMAKLAMPTSRTQTVLQQPSAVDFTMDRCCRQLVAVDLRSTVREGCTTSCRR